jgi:hypothetical protein
MSFTGGVGVGEGDGDAVWASDAAETIRTMQREYAGVPTRLYMAIEYLQPLDYGTLKSSLVK